MAGKRRSGSGGHHSERKSAGLDYLVVVSDTHVGSTMGLCPPEVETDEGSRYHANQFQLWLWSCWQDFWNRVHVLTGVIGSRPRKQFGVVFNGDLIDGKHHRTVQLIHPDVSVQVAVAARILTPTIEHAKRSWVVRGTEPHVGTREGAIGAMLGSARDPSTNQFVFEQLQLRVRDCLMHFKHHIPASMRPWTEGTQLRAQLVSEWAMAAENRHEIPRVIVRSHRHKYGLYDGGDCMLVVTPPWQGMTRYARRVTAGSLSRPGGVIFDFTQMDGGVPRVIRHIYRPDPDPVMET